MDHRPQWFRYFFFFLYFFLFLIFNFFLNAYYTFENKFTGKSTVACCMSKILTQMGKLTYILDGDNIRHGLNSDLSFKAQDRAENIRRVGKLKAPFNDERYTVRS